MQKFLKQFEGVLSPMGLVLFETFLFGVASKCIDGYHGGVWESKTLTYGRKGAEKTVVSLVAPVENGVRVTSPLSGNSRVMSAEAAGLTVAILATAWQFERVAERLSEAQFNAFDSIIWALKEAAIALPEVERSAVLHVID